jgi:hypothetical protein
MRRTFIGLNRILATICAAAIVFGHATDAQAKDIDWIGWLEEFSGPGPFQGGEAAFEVKCFNVGARRVVAGTALDRLKKDVNDGRGRFGTRAREAFQKLDVAAAPPTDAAAAPRGASESALDPRREFDALITRGLRPDSVEAQAFQRRIAAELNKPQYADKPGVQEAFRNLTMEFSTAAIALQRHMTAASLGLSVDRAGSLYALKSETRFEIKKRPGTCLGTASSVDRSADVDRLAKATFVDQLWEGPKGSELPLSRTDARTGLVIGLGYYKSRENHLFDPDKTRDGDNAEPQLQIFPVDVLFHSKLSPSIDIGAGAGLTFFHNTRGTYLKDGQKVTESPGISGFPVRPHFVPLSVVVRPFRLITNKRWASGFGYRASVRYYFLDFDGEYFGAPPPPAPEPAFSQRGDFQWGWSMFFDLTQLLQGHPKP